MSAGALPTVSVLLPVHNYERFVAESLNSALDQEYPSELVEVIVVDDGSTDGSVAVIEEIVAANPGRIRLIRQQNSGQLATISRAAAEASGELLAFLDADDVWLPQKTAKQVAAYRAAENVGVVFCDMTTIDTDGAKIKASQYEPGEPDMHPVRLYARELRSNIIYGGSSMYRADVFGDPPPIMESWDWWLGVRCSHMRALGLLEIAFVPEPLALYRQHGENMLLGASGAKLVALRRRQLGFQMWAFRNMDLTPLSPTDLWLAWEGAEGFAMTAAQATGSYFQSLIEISDADRAQAEVHRARAQEARAAGDLGEETRLLFRALAWDPYAPAGSGQLRDAIARANAAAAVRHPLAGTRSFVVLADAEELLADDAMLRHYAEQMAGLENVTLAIDASAMEPGRAVPELQALVSRTGLAARDDIDILAVVEPLDAAQRHRMRGDARALYVGDDREAQPSGPPSFTPQTLAALRALVSR